jgi:hypothetical protein
VQKAFFETLYCEFSGYFLALDSISNGKTLLDVVGSDWDVLACGSLEGFVVWVENK